MAYSNRYQQYLLGHCSPSEVTSDLQFRGPTMECMICHAPLDKPAVGRACWFARRARISGLSKYQRKYWSKKRVRARA